MRGREEEWVREREIKQKITYIERSRPYQRSTEYHLFKKSSPAMLNYWSLAAILCTSERRRRKDGENTMTRGDDECQLLFRWN